MSPTSVKTCELVDDFSQPNQSYLCSSLGGFTSGLLRRLHSTGRLLCLRVYLLPDGYGEVDAHQLQDK